MSLKPTLKKEQTNQREKFKKREREENKQKDSGTFLFVIVKAEFYCLVTFCLQLLFQILTTMGSNVLLHGLLLDFSGDGN